MRTKIITINPEIKDDLMYVKYYQSEDLSYKLRQRPLDIDVDAEYAALRNNTISSSVDGEVISTKSVFKPDPNNFTLQEEITITYQ